MDILTFGANIVVVAKTFNPSIVDKHWMISNEIIDEKELGENCLSAPMVSQIDSRNFHILVVPEQMQFVPKTISENTQELVTSKLLVIIDKLPHTPYVATGINFFADVVPKNQDFHSLNKKLFFISDNPIFQEFSSPDARYGSYFSKNIFDCRLKLDIKPVTLTKKAAGPEKIEALKLNFNFHKDLPKGNQLEGIRSMLLAWGNTFDYVNKFLEKFCQMEA